jgi:hypothetical protein
MGSTYHLIKHSFDIFEAFPAIFQRRKSDENVETVDADGSRRMKGEPELSLTTKVAKDDLSF